MLNAASKDKESGVRNLTNWLEGVNKLPTLYFFDTCKMHIHQIQRWVYDENNLPKKENDDFPENLYRYTLLNPQYIPLHEINKKIKYQELGAV